MSLRRTLNNTQYRTLSCYIPWRKTMTHNFLIAVLSQQFHTHQWEMRKHPTITSLNYLTLSYKNTAPSFRVKLESKRESFYVDKLIIHYFQSQGKEKTMHCSRPWVSILQGKNWKANLKQPHCMKTTFDILEANVASVHVVMDISSAKVLNLIVKVVTQATGIHKDKNLLFFLMDCF